ncbi:unnamed protein product [Adineta steineri]|uniref:Uncharacterized protein n=1 Tax=Adineta steineri TaxID=433720 RepID=A0A815ETB0_9BILA|nr:unnamed protein product [Adineta steineri]CAF3658488.1 unnamed protein product [Adineta steineri]
MTTSTKRDQYDDKKSSVVRDQIWKDHVSKIDIAQKNHDTKWGFLNGLQPQANAYDPKRSPRALLARADPSLVKQNENSRELPQQHVTVCPSPRPIPITTSNLIGWRTADKNCTLEKYGKYTRGQESLHKKFKWPIEGFD